LLTGHPPFWRGDIAHQILNDSPAGIPGVSEEINSLVSKCLSKTYHDRYQDFAEIISALEEKPLGNVDARKAMQTLLRRPEAPELLDPAFQDLIEAGIPREEVETTRRRQREFHVGLRLAAFRNSRIRGFRREAIVRQISDFERRMRKYKCLQNEIDEAVSWKIIEYVNAWLEEKKFELP
jgi:hypothetical protein